MTKMPCTQRKKWYLNLWHHFGKWCLFRQKDAILVPILVKCMGKQCLFGKRHQNSTQKSTKTVLRTTKFNGATYIFECESMYRPFGVKCFCHFCHPKCCCTRLSFSSHVRNIKCLQIPEFYLVWSSD